MLPLLRCFNGRALGQGSRTTNCFKRVTRKRTRRVEVFYRNLKRGVRLKAEKIRQKKSQKRWINKSSMQSRNVHDFLTEIVLYKQKQPDDISVRQ